VKIFTTRSRWKTANVTTQRLKLPSGRSKAACRNCSKRFESASETASHCAMNYGRCSSRSRRFNTHDARDKKLEARGIDPNKAQADFEMQASQGSALLLLLQAVESVASVFARMKWGFLVATDHRLFFTSDKPVCCWLPADRRSIFGVALTDPDVEITFPLSRRVGAFGCWNSPYQQPFHLASAEIVDSFNESAVAKSSDI